MWLNREFHRPCNCTAFSVLFPQAWQIGSTCSLLYSTIFCYILFIYWYILLVRYRYNLHIRWVFFIIAVLVAQSCPTLWDPMHRLLPTRFLCPWDSPGKNTGVGCHSLLPGIFPTQGSNPGLPHWRQIIFTTWATIRYIYSQQVFTCCTNSVFLNVKAIHTLF